MDALFSALGHSLRLRSAEALLHGGPASQEALRRELEVSPGTMSKPVKVLTSVGLVQRATPRGPCFLPHRVLTERWLQAGADLAEVIAVDRALDAKARAKELRRTAFSVNDRTSSEGAL